MNSKKQTALKLFIVVIGILFSASSYANNSNEPPAGYKPQKGSATPFQVIVADNGKSDILLIQTAIPWNSNADTTVLDNLGYSYEIIDITEVETTNINDYQVVLIVNDQVQAFYDNYATNYQKFENYVKDGGVLVFFACDHGWAGGNNYTNLPGNVVVGDRINSTNIIAHYAHPIVTQELTGGNNPPLTNDDMNGTYCSHNYFDEATLPVGANTVFRTDDTDQYPTFVVYPLGNGKVIASGLTWEYTYDRYAVPGTQYGFGRVLPDVFKYAFALAGGHKISGINIDIYPEDNWLTKRPTLYKAKGDLIDIVANITNNTNPNEEQNDIDLTLSSV